MATAADFTPDAFALRTTDANGQSHGGFQWPSEVGAIVTAPDWSARPECGGGLHGLPDGLGDYDLLSSEHDALWWVVSFIRAEAVDLDGKVKFPRCRVEYFGRMPGAMKLISTHCIKRMLELAEGNTSTGGGSHAASTGDRSHAEVAGKHSVAVAVGIKAMAKAAAGGAISLAAYDDDWELVAVRSSLVGQNGIKPDVWYRLTAGGEFERVEAA